MRILMLSQFFRPVIGGEERMVETMSVELARRGHQVALATLNTAQQPRHEAYRGVGVYRVTGAAQRMPSLYRDAERPHAPPVPDPLLMRDLLAVIRRERPDVMHGHNWLANSAMPLARLLGIPFVLSLHDYGLVCATHRFVHGGEPCRGPALVRCSGCASRHYGAVKGRPVALATRAMRPIVLSAVDMFLPVSHAVARRTRLAELNAPWRVVPDFLPSEPADAVDEPPAGLPPDGFTLFVGDLSVDKGIDVLLEAYGSLDGAPPLVLIGRRLSPQVDVPRENVVVLGPRPHSEVAAAWRRCGLGVIPSITEESFGLVALEAMAAGRPLIASRHGGLPEVVADGKTGLLVKPGDVGALREALCLLLSDPDARARMGQAALEHASRFSPAAVVPQLEDVYRLVGAPGPGRSRTSRPAPRAAAVATPPAAVGTPLSVAVLDRAPAVSVAASAGAPGEVPWRPGLGLIPVLVLTSATGVALVSIADALARSGRPHAQLLFWLGLLTIFLPITARLVSRAPTRGERAVLLLTLGLAFYLVKVLRDPFGFTYSDELVHQGNVLSILDARALFGHNPILSVTPLYPGLEAITAAIASLAGISSFLAGVIVIAFARAILMLGLFLLFETVTGSARIAGLAAALYAVSPHYLFFTAQFSYESLALPLTVLAACAVNRARPPAGRSRPAWAIVAALAIVAVIVTHHMSSYGLVALLLAICLVPLPWRRVPARRPWALAIGAAIATMAWLLLVASETVGYLSPVLTNAIAATFRTAAGETSTRALFHSASGQSAPIWEHWVGIASTAVIGVAIPVGLTVLWRRHRDHPLLALAGLASLAYVGTLGMRVVPAAWETAVRASDFLFIGVALVVALAALEALDRSPARPLARVSATLLAALLLVGGVIAAASASDRVAQPYRIAVGRVDLDPAGVAVARWAGRVLGPGQRIAAEEADARLLYIYGREQVVTGSNPPIATVLQTPILYRWQWELLRRQRIRYVVVDARTASADVTSGYYFPRRPVGPGDRFPAAAVTKFERAGARRIYDNGEIFVDDLAGVTDASVVR
jgi:glycosyltransferase involved in cell wall biosynthesis